MASKRHARRKQCTGKKRHDTSDAAYAHRRWIARTQETYGRLVVYKCSFCKKYHVGTESAKRAKARKANQRIRRR
jgi:hypothetical protein